ncbi:hypothetical protein HK104_010163, partial [Borealophlyctis nickersoniae]
MDDDWVESSPTPRGTPRALRERKFTDYKELNDGRSSPSTRRRASSASAEAQPQPQQTAALPRPRPSSSPSFGVASTSAQIGSAFLQELQSDAATTQRPTALATPRPRKQELDINTPKTAYKPRPKRAQMKSSQDAVNDEDHSMVAVKKEQEHEGYSAGRPRPPRTRPSKPSKLAMTYAPSPSGSEDDSGPELEVDTEESEVPDPTEAGFFGSITGWMSDLRIIKLLGPVNSIVSALLSWIISICMLILRPVLFVIDSVGAVITVPLRFISSPAVGFLLIGLLVAYNAPNFSNKTSPSLEIPVVETPYDRPVVAQPPKSEALPWPAAFTSSYWKSFLPDWHTDVDETASDFGGSETVVKLFSRLSQVEQTVGSLQKHMETGFKDLHARGAEHARLLDHEKALGEEHESQIAELGNRLADLVTMVAEATAVAGDGKDVAHITSEHRRQLQMMQEQITQLPALQSQISGNEERNKGFETALGKLQGEMRALLAKFQDMDARLIEVEKQTFPEHVTKRVVDLIHAHVPNLLVARMDDGKIEMRPEFWRYLSERLATKEEEVAMREDLTALGKAVGDTRDDVKAAKATSDALKERMDEQRSALVSKHELDKAIQNSPKAVTPPSFSEFLEENKAQLESLISGELEDRQRKGVILTRAEVLSWIENRVKSLGESLGESLDKLNTTEKQVDDSQIRSIMESVIESALERYSTDVLAKADWALESGGARVIESLTSKTYTMEYDRWPLRAFTHLFGVKKASGRPPRTALDPANHPGHCWAMRGTTGTLGIYLSEEIIPTDITLEHVSPVLVSKAELTSAPKEIEIWGVMDPVRFGHLDLDSKITRNPPLPDHKSRTSKPGHRTDPAAVLLGEMTFDPKVKSIQTFPVRQAAQDIIAAYGGKVGTVVVRIKNNWGNDKWTCLYR